MSRKNINKSMYTDKEIFEIEKTYIKVKNMKFHIEDVSIKSLVRKNKKIVFFKETSCNSECIVQELKSDKVYTTFFYDLEPLEITNNVLKLFNSYKKKQNFIYIDNLNMLIKTDNNYSYYYNDKYIMDIKYVHELQSLYKLFNKKNLAYKEYEPNYEDLIVDE